MRMTTTRTIYLATALAAATGLAVACGGSSSNSSSSSPASPTTTPSGAVTATTITISGNVVSPKNIIVSRGSQVTFVNNDTIVHQMFSDPHPEHTDCPEINNVGFLAPGERRTTGNMVTNKAVCGFHDHDLPNIPGLTGTISIQ